MAAVRPVLEFISFSVTHLLLVFTARFPHSLHLPPAADGTPITSELLLDAYSMFGVFFLAAAGVFYELLIPRACLVRYRYALGMCMWLSFHFSRTNPWLIACTSLFCLFFLAVRVIAEPVPVRRVGHGA